MGRRFVSLLALGLVGIVVLGGCGPTAVAKYDAGRSLQSRKHFKSAIQKYTEYVDENKDSPLVPWALIYIARCQVALADKPAAMAAYKKVTDRFPEHEVARWAEAEMRDIKDKKLVPVNKPPKPKRKPKPKKK